MLNYIKEKYVELNHEFNAYREFKRQLDAYNMLPWYKRVFTNKPTTVKSYKYYPIPLVRKWDYSIELRMSFFGSSKEIVLAVAERISNGVRGFKMNVITHSREPMIGGKYTDKVSPKIEEVLLKICSNLDVIFINELEDYIKQHIN